MAEKCFYEKKEFCDTLKKYGQVYFGKLTKGIRKVEIMTEINGEYKVVGAYHYLSLGKGDNLGTRLKFCPFCGERL